MIRSRKPHRKLARRRRALERLLAIKNPKPYQVHDIEVLRESTREAQ